jgi:murein DD-endopeptidase MepM/ murein hydrolase activator NlpD
MHNLYSRFPQLIAKTWATSAMLTMVSLVFGSSPGMPQSSPETSNSCPAPVLSRLSSHRVARGETLETIAEQYNLISATILGLNPNIQSGSLRVGQDLVIPPFNGIRVTVPQGQTWQEVAQAYNSRADVLFEVNGCVSAVPREVFVPGVNWFPGVQTVATPRTAEGSGNALLGGYPLPNRTDVVVNYGWQPAPGQDELVFNTGIALSTDANTPVLAVGNGTVAFAGEDQIYGNLVVVNHERGLQTRYANLGSVTVEVGQRIQQGATLGRVGAATSEESFLFFEVRLNSEMGWVAQDPQDHVPSLALR